MNAAASVKTPRTPRVVSKQQELASHSMLLDEGLMAGLDCRN